MSTKRAQIEILVRAGKGTVEIANLVGCAHTTVRRVRSIVEAGESLERKPGSGRPAKLDVVEVKNMFKANPMVSITSVAKANDVSRSTMSRAVKKAGDKSVHLGTLVVGALSADPSKFTKDYCGLFTASGLMPKKKLARFPVTENAIIQPGTPLFASHFDIGQFVDVRGRSRRKGFHGVMKRWGFAGMPSDERGVTKSHRRPGHIGSGAKKARVWPGQKMPGHVGGNSSVTRGLKILRINHEHNVLYIQGQSIPGEPGEMVQIFDCRTNGKDHVESPKYFPTCYPEEFDKLPEEEYSEVMHRFEDPTIMFQSEETSKKGKK
eukprot:maker-scaffold191_size271209-snap-gene-0.9 protein:Tk06176 transcript:maker-scaffold191_size271209-snap-gene-0.9-mRNA-1 annotation:"39s ribosomal protein mitochondrial"